MSTLAQCLSAAYENKETVTVGSGGSIPLCTELMELNPDAELALFSSSRSLSTSEIL